jgi:serine/threonine-protein kinase
MPVGTTAESTPLTVDLPKGSYLFVFRLPGYLDLRYPVAMPPTRKQRARLRQIRLLKVDEIPRGFVPVPGGMFTCGGDSEVDQSLELDQVPVAEFFMKRLEVTFGEYLEFVNSPENRERIDPRTGHVRPLASWDDVVVPAEKTTAPILPVWNEEKLFDFEEKTRSWSIRDPSLFHCPVFGITYLAVLEYVHWLNQKFARAGKRWRVRLPTDLEWEKAARGVDRRFLVWGNYLVRSFCKSLRGTRGHGYPEVVGAYPMDESVYGVRDLAGSVAEFTCDRTVERFISVRGGSWDRIDDYPFRIANRNGLLPEGWGRDTGIRLVAEPAES